jgi:aspartate aminotransferase-like enzyme
MMFKKRLFTPGPTPVPEHVMLAMAQPMIHHRHPEFGALFRRVNENLQYLFQTNQSVITLTSSGTGAMEAAVVNLLSAGDVALFVNAGKFGERWGELCRAYGIQAEEIPVPWGESVDPQTVGERLKKNRAVKAVFITHSETSTGAVQDVRTVARVVREHSEALVVVDGITSVGAVELRMDDWGLDVVMSGSQKALMIPPGLAFIAMGDRAWQQVGKSRSPRYYFDLGRARKTLEKNETPWTPAVSLFVGLDVALEMIRSEGLDQVWKRHAILADAVRSACIALGLRLLAKIPSNALTAVFIPESIDAKKFSSSLKQTYGITVAGGQGNLKGKIFRISHLGYYDMLDAIAVVSAIEMALRDSGWEFEMGAGVRAAQQCFTKI